MQVIELAAFDQEHAGSFVPLLVAVMEEVSRRGWQGGVVLPERARGRQWLADFDATGAEIHFVEDDNRRGSTAQLTKIVGRFKGPVVLHTHFTRFDVPAAIVARRTKEASVIWHVHTTLHKGLVPFLRNTLKYALLGRTVDLILCPSAQTETELRQRLAPVGRIDVLPSSIDLGSYSPITPEWRERARRALDLPADAVVLLHFGWDWELKGGDLMLETAEALREMGVGHKLIALTRDSPEARRAVGMAKLDDVVRLLEPVEDVRDLYAASDVLVVSSMNEGMPFTLVESLACGTPAVATDIPGHAFIGDEVDACRLAQGSGLELAAAVEETLSRGPGKAAAEAEDARAWLASNLSVEMACRRLADTFERQAAEG